MKPRYLDCVRVEAKGERLQEAGEVAEDFLVLQPEVVHDHVVHVVVRQQIKERPVIRPVSTASAYMRRYEG